MMTGTISDPGLQWFLSTQDEEEDDDDDEWPPPHIVASMTGTVAAPAPSVEPTFGPDDIEGMRWLYDVLISDNNRLRRERDSYRRQVQMWELNALMGWSTLPYPDLTEDEFSEN